MAEVAQHAASLPCHLVTLQRAGDRARKGFRAETEFGVPASEPSPANPSTRESDGQYFAGNSLRPEEVERPLVAACDPATNAV
jgi:hypothetical protein